ncbi:hypothetical protein HK103_007427 [Boothiomyces macroporosus]|uniref:Uncharacterized protein n=1 Tax=Boothiomyces macroporosus TaxID=261099 RepID=A0AAD5UN10_9FUNG|nr:hypothetical protein HK103_007427 [Boothiomyces macroporosus]
MFLQIASLLIASASAQFTDKCGLPADNACLVKNAQYTFVGTVTSNTISSGGSASNYNATLSVRCMFASFSSPPSSGEGLVGNTITVTGWGVPNPKCPNGLGAAANVQDTNIYFINVAQRPQAGQSAQNIIYAVQDICVGGIPFNQANLQTISDVLAQNPGNAITGAAAGTDAACTLPKSSVSSSSSTTGSSGTPQFNAGARPETTYLAFAAFLVGSVFLSM